MKTISELRDEYEIRTGCAVRYYKAYPVIGRGSVVHNWIDRMSVESVFRRASVISPLQKLRWWLGGLMWK